MEVFRLNALSWWRLIIVVRRGARRIWFDNSYLLDEFQPLHDLKFHPKYAGNIRYLMLLLKKYQSQQTSIKFENQFRSRNGFSTFHSSSFKRVKNDKINIKAMFHLKSKARVVENLLWAFQKESTFKCYVNNLFFLFHIFW